METKEYEQDLNLCAKNAAIFACICVIHSLIFYSDVNILISCNNFSRIKRKADVLGLKRSGRNPDSRGTPQNFIRVKGKGKTHRL